MKMHLALLLWLLPIASALSQTAAPDLIYPKSGSVFLAGPVNFEWDEAPNAIIYHLQVSADDSFATAVFNDASLVNPFYAAAGLPMDTQLRWRVRAFDGVDSTNWSAVHSLYLLDPHTLGDMQLWVRGDSGVIGGTAASQWQDLSGNNVQLMQAAPAYRPTLTTAPTLNNAPVLNFDGLNDYLDGGQALELHTNDQTILVVFNDFIQGSASSTQNRIIQKRGHTTNTDGWCLAPKGDTWNSSVIEKGPASANQAVFQHQNAQPPIYSVGDGTYRIVSTVWDNDTASWDLYTNGRHYIHATNTGDLRGEDISNPAKPLTIGCSYNPAPLSLQFFFKGNIAEIMVFHTALGSATRGIAEEYLQFKYAPPVNLGRNISLGYGLCASVTLDAGSHFVSYYWSTGETTSSIQVTSPGTYWVLVTDIFGVSSYDEIVVTGGVNDLSRINEISICPGDTLIWDTQLSHSGHNFLWSNGSTDSSITITQFGVYLLEITDSIGCSFDDTLLVSNVQCGPCNVSFFYSNEDSLYILQNTSSGQNITASWDLGDGTTSTDWGVLHTYPEGTYNVCLTVSALQTAAVFTASIADTMLIVSFISYGSLDINQLVSGMGVTQGTTITGQIVPMLPGESVGGVGRYSITNSQTVASFPMKASVLCVDSVCQTLNVPCPKNTFIQQNQCTADTALLNLPDTCAAVNSSIMAAERVIIPEFMFFSGSSQTYSNTLSGFKGGCREITNVRVEVVLFDFDAFPLNLQFFLRNQFMGSVIVPKARIVPPPPSSLLSNWDDGGGGWYSNWTFSSDDWNGTDPANINWFMHAVNSGADTDCWVEYKIIISYNWGDPADAYNMDSLTANSGCDSIVITRTNYIATASDTVHVSICPGDSVFAAGDYQFSPGTYTDTLINAHGCDSLLVTEITMLPVDSCCKASFTYTKLQDTYSFVNNSNGNNLTYLWDFGDGFTSMYLNSLHTYPIGGSYNACLFISNPHGCADTACVSLSIPCATTFIQLQQCVFDTTLLPGNCLQTNTAIKEIADTIGLNGFAGHSLTYHNLIPSFQGSCRSITNVQLEVTLWDIGTFPLNLQFFLRNHFMDEVNVPKANLNLTPPLPANPPLVALWSANDGFDGWYSKWTFSTSDWNGTDPANTDWFVHAVNSGPDTDFFVSYRVFISYNWGGPTGTVVTDTFQNATGCDSIVITQTEFVPHKAESVQISICPGDSVFAAGDYQFSPGTYIDSLVTTGGCDSLVVTEITFLPADSCCKALFTYINQQSTYTFHNTPSGVNLSYAWDFDDGNTSTQQNPVHTFTNSGTYNVCLTISDTSGCSDTYCSFVNVPAATNDGCCRTQVNIITNTTLPSDSAFATWSSAFSPNNDGVNDTWRVFTRSYQSISITVSRNGEVAFQTNDAATSWDGTCGGFPVDGLFDVSVVLTSASGGTLEKAGTVCVWRDCIDHTSDWQQCNFPNQFDGSGFAVTLPNFEPIHDCGNWFCLGQDSATTCADTSLNHPGCGDLVWPGDANADGIANNQDVLAVGIGYGISGFTRPNATTNWVGQPSPDWLLQLAGGANLKHVDCDGNALIDSNDVAVISLNYGMTHSKGGSPEDRAIGDLFLEFPLDSFVTGDSVVGSLHLGSASALVSNVYGIAFSITYDHNLIDTNSFRLAFVNSWMAPDNNRISLTKDFYLASKIEAGVSRIDHNNASGAGKIADVSFVIQDNIDGKDFITLPLVIQFENVLAIDKDEASVPVTASGDTLYITGEITGIFGAEEKDEVRIFPNPATDEIFVEADFAIAEYNILDLAGREVVRKQAVPGTGERFSVDVSALETGSYFINLVNADRFTICRKIVVLR